MAQKKSSGKATATSKKPTGGRLKPKKGSQSNTNNLKAAMQKLAGQETNENE